MPDITSPNDIFALFGRSIIQEYVSPMKKQGAFLPLPPRAVSDEPVGILGAGVGGLYTALILQSLNVSYEIIEASNRTGGRMFTHKFSDGGLYDYFVCFNYYCCFDHI
jgi:NAD(P)-binding Rossmann-like domain